MVCVRMRTELPDNLVKKDERISPVDPFIVWKDDSDDIVSVREASSTLWESNNSNRETKKILIR